MCVCVVAHLVQSQFLYPAVYGAQCVRIRLHVYLMERNCKTTVGSRAHVVSARRYLTGYVFSVTEAVVDGSEPTEHGSGPYPHHRDSVASHKQSEAVQTSRSSAGIHPAT